jgi:NTP pyrophosphatase (non-canonical NTP hydrolase)
MNDNRKRYVKNTLQDLIEQIREFTLTRGLEKTDTPKNLAIAMSIEASEVLEVFQWLESGELTELDENQLLQVKREVADVFIYLVAISERLKFSLLDAANEKMQLNLIKYPPFK